jgi:hypothetical protein
MQLKYLYGTKINENQIDLIKSNEIHFQDLFSKLQDEEKQIEFVHLKNNEYFFGIEITYFKNKKIKNINKEIFEILKTLICPNLSSNNYGIFINSQP